MNDFFQTKIGIALALLGALFALWPLIDHAELEIISVGAFTISLKTAYFTTLILFGLAVYLFAIQFALNKEMKVAGKIANSIYVIALSAPGVVFILWLTTIVVGLLSPLLNSDKMQVVSSVVGVAAAILGGITQIRSYLRRVRRTDSDITKRHEASERYSSIEHYKSLLGAGYYEMAIVEAFKPVEQLLQSAASSFGMDRSQLSLSKVVDLLVAKGGMKPDYGEVFQELVRLRNRAVHEKQKITQRDALQAGLLSERMMLWFDEFGKIPDITLSKKMKRNRLKRRRLSKVEISR